jgi:hypothetical protein
MRRDLQAGVGPTTLTKRWYVDGTQSDVGVVTYAVTNGAGTVIASGTATKSGAAATTIYTFSLPTVADPTVLRIRWTRSDTGAYLDDLLEVFGSLLFTEAEARAKQTTGQIAPLADETKYPDDLIATWRLKIQEAFEERTGRSWVRRYCRLETSGRGLWELGFHDGYNRTSWGAEVGGAGRQWDIRRILSATVGGVAVTVGDLRILGSTLHHTVGTWGLGSLADPLNVVVEYEYGIDPTWEAHENGLRAILAFAPPQSQSDWATSVSDESGSRNFELAWPPKVWDWLKSADVRIPIA